MLTDWNAIQTNSTDEEAMDVLESNGVEVMHVNGKAFVSLDDYNALIRGLVEKVVELTKAQNIEVMRVANSLDIIRGELARNYPEVLEVVEEEINRRMRLS